ncbi:hypothetical protein IX317_000070 [Fusobacterium sp. DD29]|uniref:phage holin, LLH family n=1 Tax=unclassified Fusobacterium TaxID=2648384 RepID=UPI001B8A8F97|nr:MULTISPECIES: hypothetical protein [unclassified Fusobacterium]MBR8701173.1 hypothetical protein [Fusobacterium sp. DD45]MBR8711944.1 hypothetical protein [Fusobacterium sp. DD28]MBR8748413.1 hypothetical protein [Fusobacterium sp. DD29]MBR8752517.1 hypothetical protein [Fusobacterium sp. DD26]MBR8760613.1 hypothetical protein [Fusobacterium sp. DD25]
MSNKIFYIGTGILVLVVVALVILKFVFKKQGKISKEEKVTALLNRLAYYAVCIAETIYKDGNGQKKLDAATKIIRSKIPLSLSDLIPDEMIHEYIEKALDTLQVVFKSKKNDEINMLDKIIDVASKSQDTKATLELVKNMRDSKGYVEGYAEGRTNFHGKTEGVIGVKAGMKL